MFDIGFTELLLVAIVALVVLGPERLPKAARFAGLWVRRARAQWYSVKSELERELAADELKRTVQDTRATMQEITDSVREADADARREFETMRADTLAADTLVVEPPVAMTPSDHRNAPDAVDGVVAIHDEGARPATVVAADDEAPTTPSEDDDDVRPA